VALERRLLRASFHRTSSPTLPTDPDLRLWPYPELCSVLKRRRCPQQLEGRPARLWCIVWAATLDVSSFLSRIIDHFEIPALMQVNSFCGDFCL
jgi:hypothetical protein